MILKVKFFLTIIAKEIINLKHLVKKEMGLMNDEI